MRSILALAALAASAVAQSNNTLVTALSGNSNLTTLTQLVSGIPGLADALAQMTNVTILAPSNDAIAAFLNSSSSANATLGNTELVQAILSYHVLNGTINSTQITSNATFVPTHLTSPLLANVTGGQRVGAVNSSGTVQIISGLGRTSNVTTADVVYNNGIVHVINTILTPPSNISDTAVQFGLSAAAGALTELDLVDVVDGASDLTVFVPNNAAFQAISSVLANASMETLESVLKYHVVNGSVLYSPLITGNTSVTSFGGQNISVSVVNGDVYVNQAKVVVANVLVANGVVHVIDSVLNPGNATAAPGTNQTGFGNATSGTDIPFTSGVPTPTASATIPPAASRSSSAGAAYAKATGFVGAGVLFAGALMAL